MTLSASASESRATGPQSTWLMEEWFGISILTEITITDFSHVRYLGICSSDDAGEFLRSKLCSLLDAGCVVAPLQDASYQIARRANMRGGVHRNGEHLAVRNVLANEKVQDFIPRRRIELG
jgi:hypothetical protein